MSVKRHFPHIPHSTIFHLMLSFGQFDSVWGPFGSVWGLFAGSVLGSNRVSIRVKLGSIGFCFESFGDPFGFV